MQIKNEYIKIKSGGKECTLRNWMYDSYLKLFSDRQKELYEMQETEETVDTMLQVCCIKVNTPLENYKNANANDFDIFIPYKSVETTGNEQAVNVIYTYSSLINNYSKSLALSEYNGQKITAIGFCAITDFENESPVYTLYACVDTSYYSINISSEEGISISRKDTFSSNAFCNGNEYPIHLSPVPPKRKIDGDFKNIRSVLYSVGFGITKGQMQQEFLIGRDSEIQTISDTKFGVVMKNPIDVPKYPGTNVFPSSSRYPVAPKYRRSLYPQASGLYLGSNRYPMRAGYNYIIFKYRLYCAKSSGTEYLNDFYTMSYLHNPRGIFIITNTIERGE